jgi:phosphoribosyl-AMP cyclohydrolase
MLSNEFGVQSSESKLNSPNPELNTPNYLWGVEMEIDFKKGDGLIPVIVQDASTDEILMLAYMNREAWEATLRTKKATYWSRSRDKIWVKGETSAHFQEVKEVLLDCDGDTLLLKVKQLGGAACHTGYRSCFHRRYERGGWKIFGEKVFDPKEVYEK